MLTAPPSASTNKPELVAVRDRHLLARIDVSNGDSYHSQFSACLHFVKARSRVARVIEQTEFPSPVESIDADPFVTCASRLEVHAIAVIWGAIFTRRTKKLHVAKVLSDDFACGYRLRGGNSSHACAKSFADHQGWALTLRISTDPVKEQLELVPKRACLAFKQETALQRTLQLHPVPPRRPELTIGNFNLGGATYARKNSTSVGQVSDLQSSLAEFRAVSPTTVKPGELVGESVVDARCGGGRGVASSRDDEWLVTTVLRLGPSHHPRGGSQ